MLLQAARGFLCMTPRIPHSWPWLLSSTRATRQWTSPFKVATPTYLAQQTGWGYLGDSTFVFVIDITEPAMPVTIGRVGMPGVTAMDIAVEGHTVCIAEHSARFIDVSDPTAPVHVADKHIGDGAYDVTMGPKYAYFAAPTHGCMDVIDFTTAGLPLAKSLGNVHTCRDIALDGTYVYIVGS